MSQKSGALAPKAVESFRKSFESRPEYRVAMNAVTRGELEEVALNRRVIDRLDWHFSHEVPPGGVTAQKQAGTCWLFAGLNWLRKIAMGKMQVEAFQFSQNYLVFWDRLEKANRFLEQMIALRDRPVDDREVHHHLSQPTSDGGDWLLLADLIEKYGLVPRASMADTSNLGATAPFNKVLSYKLREAAATLRRMHRDGRKLGELREAKLEILETIYRMLVILFGEPPRRVDLAYRTRKEKFCRESNLTPRDVFEKLVGVNLRDYHHLLSSPMESTPYYRPYSIGGTRNIEGSGPGLSLNVPLQVVRDLAVKLLAKKQPVLFDCDVTHGLNRKLGIFDTELHDYPLMFDTPFRWERAERMEYFHQRPTHSMVLLGVDLVDGRPAKWKIENSWSDENGEKGVFQMSDRWFEENVYGLTVHRKVLGDKLVKLFEQPVIDLPPWHTLS